MITLTEWQSKAALGPSLPRPREILSTSVDEALAHGDTIGGPVVAKASGVPHKSDRGLVRTGLDAATLRECWAPLATAGDGTVLVAEQLRVDLELIVGGVRDPQFGPLVSVGMGGIRAEVDPDVVFLLAPVDDGELEHALGRLRGHALLGGYRGIEPIDLAALRAVVDAIVDLLDTDPSVVEIDCNPVIADRGRLFVADALVVVDREAR